MENKSIKKIGEMEFWQYISAFEDENKKVDEDTYIKNKKIINELKEYNNIHLLIRGNKKDGKYFTFISKNVLNNEEGLATIKGVLRKFTCFIENIKSEEFTNSDFFLSEIESEYISRDQIGCASINIYFENDWGKNSPRL